MSRLSTFQNLCSRDRTGAPDVYARTSRYTVYVLSIRSNVKCTLRNVHLQRGSRFARPPLLPACAEKTADTYTYLYGKSRLHNGLTTSSPRITSRHGRASARALSSGSGSRISYLAKVSRALRSRYLCVPISRSCGERVAITKKHARRTITKEKESEGGRRESTGALRYHFRSIERRYRRNAVILDCGLG